MAYRRRPTRRRTTRRRRTTNRRRPANRRIVRYRRSSLPLSGFPTQKVVRLRYVSDRFSLNPALGGIASHVFRANSIYDPDFTGVGHQPYGHDTWQTLYNHYTVLGSKIVCRLQSTSGTPSASFGLVGIRLDDSGASLATLGLNVEAGRCNYRYIGTDDSSHGMVTLRKNYSARKMWGRMYNASGTQRATFGFNPSEEVYYVITAEAGAAYDMGELLCQAVVEYIVLLQEPKELSQS